MAVRKKEKNPILLLRLKFTEIHMKTFSSQKVASKSRKLPGARVKYFSYTVKICGKIVLN